jgi:uncharacterized membrane protein
MNKMFRVVRVPAGLLAAALAASSAHAVVDVGNVVTEISGTLAPIGLIGAGVLLVYVAIKAFKWISRAM